MGFPLCLSPPTPKEAVLWFQIFFLLCNGKKHWTELWRGKIKILGGGRQETILIKIKHFFLLIEKWDKKLSLKLKKIETWRFRKCWNQILQANKKYFFHALFFFKYLLGWGRSVCKWFTLGEFSLFMRYYLVETFPFAVKENTVYFKGECTSVLVRKNLI